MFGQRRRIRRKCCFSCPLQWFMIWAHEEIKLADTCLPRNLSHPITRLWDGLRWPSLVGTINLDSWCRRPLEGEHWKLPFVVCPKLQFPIMSSNGSLWFVQTAEQDVTPGCAMEIRVWNTPQADASGCPLLLVDEAGKGEHMGPMHMAMPQVCIVRCFWFFIPGNGWHGPTTKHWHLLVLYESEGAKLDQNYSPASSFLCGVGKPVHVCTTGRT